LHLLLHLLLLPLLPLQRIWWSLMHQVSLQCLLLCLMAVPLLLLQIEAAARQVGPKWGAAA
jgi:hypothetical protein